MTDQTITPTSDLPMVLTSGVEATVRTGTVALLGPTNAGKSTLLNMLLGEKLAAVSPKPQMTRDQILGVLHREDAEIVFVDSPGFEGALRNGALAKHLKQNLSHAGSDVDMVALVLDAVRAERGIRYVEEAIEQLSESRLPRPKIVLLNKIDLLPHEALLPLLERVSTLLEEKLRFLPEIVPISAQKKRNKEELLQTITRLLPVGVRMFPKDMKSDVTDQFVITECIRERLYLAVQQEVPYSAAVSLEQFKIEQKLIRIGAVIVVERDSQKGIVIGKGGEVLKRIGTGARKELEKRFGKKVFLQLHVRVEEEWTKSADGLRRAGLTAKS